MPDKQRGLAVEGPPPYVSYRQWTKLLDALPSFMPSRFDSSYFENMGISTTCRSMLRSALRFLGLMSYDGVPTHQLRQLVKSDAETRPKEIEAIIRAAYAPLFVRLDVAHASWGQVKEYFASQGITGDIARKCWRFFAALATDAGIELSPQLDKSKRRKMAEQIGKAPKDGHRDKSRHRSSGNTPDNETITWEKAVLEKFPNLDPEWPVELKAKWFDDLKYLVTLGSAPTKRASQIKRRNPKAR